MRRRVFGIRLSRLLIVVGGFFAIASVIAVALIFVVNDTRAAINADRRIREAFGSIQVHHPTAGGGGGTSRISQFMYRIEGQGRNSTRYSSVSMHIDVGQMLASSGVEADDFNRARAHFYEYQSELYRGLGEIFAVTDDLFITLRQLGDDEIEYYNLPPDVAAMNHFDLNISNFLDSDEKIFRLDTDFGKLILHSSFFFGRISDSEMGLVSNLAFAQDPDAEVVLRFGYEENGDEITVQLEILDQDGEPIHLEFPGRSMLIALPLSLDFMRGSQGRIFDAVEYVDPVRSAILPRSFRDDSYLYILTNRTGMFRLITTEHGTTINQAETSAIHLANFLYDRGIDPE
ncbi:MAG: hypothetical protein FWE42_00005, partial [Defluviitaleaceae bacterium]|nr:hypothetical protein [Defluviitaleaceae bacterium]